MRIFVARARCENLCGLRAAGHQWNWADGTRRCSGQNAQVFAAARLPDSSTRATLPAAETLAATHRLIAAVEAAAQPPEKLFGDPRATSLFGGLATACSELDAQQLRGVLAAFARCQHMPPELWRQGFAEEVPRILEDLPDMAAVHVALLMASLDLRDRVELLQEVAEQLEMRAQVLEPTALTAALVALSQLGPWSSPVPGAPLVQELQPHLSTLQLSQLSACALAVATLSASGLSDGLAAETGFWMMAPAALLERVGQMLPRHLADTLLALATAQRRPIALLEALQERLTQITVDVEPDEALTCAWALAALQIYPTKALVGLMESIAKLEDFELSVLQADQLHQVALSLELDPKASKVKASLPEHLQGSLQARIQSDAQAGSDRLCTDDAAASEIYEMLVGKGAECTLAVSIADGFYSVDLLATLPGKSSDASCIGVLLDGVSRLDASAPCDPFLALKRRHLPLIGCPVEWLVTRNWHAWDSEKRERVLDEIFCNLKRASQ